MTVRLAEPEAMRVTHLTEAKFVGLFAHHVRATGTLGALLCTGIPRRSVAVVSSTLPWSVLSGCSPRVRVARRRHRRRRPVDPRQPQLHPRLRRQPARCPWPSRRPARRRAPRSARSAYRPPARWRAQRQCRRRVRPSPSHHHRRSPARRRSSASRCTRSTPSTPAAAPPPARPSWRCSAASIPPSRSSSRLTRSRLGPTSRARA